MIDLLGVGFGPANLSLAINMHEEQQFNMQFLERKKGFSWHPNMLTEGAQMQVSFLKDLASIRNPQSEYTFLNYLKEKNRLETFANLRDFYPSRLEFGDYLAWAANKMQNYVTYGENIVRIDPQLDQVGYVDHLKVVTLNLETGKERFYLAKNLSIAIGGTSKVPGDINLSNLRHAFHSNDFLSSLEHNYPDKSAEYRFVVVGSGQSATELFYHLAVHYPNSFVTQTIHGYAIKPADETEFVNEIFTTAAAELFYGLDEVSRGKLLNAHRDTNYSAVDPSLIKQVYRILYEQKISGGKRLNIHNFMHLDTLEESHERNLAKYSHAYTGSPIDLEYDGLFLATGYHYNSHLPLLESLKNYIEFNAKGQVEVDQNYRAVTKGPFAPRIYLQGPSEHTHGLTETLLSMMSIRASKIASDLTPTVLSKLG